MHIQDYFQPTTLTEALEYMHSEGRVKALAGGTDLVISLHERTIEADAVVDLSKIQALKEISLQADGLHIGAMATFTQLERSELIQAHCPMLSCAASKVGSPQVRNSGTIGGNLANAATAADTVPVLMAMDALAVIKKAGGCRVVPVTEIPTGLNQTCLEPDELIVEFILKPQPGSFMDFEKIGRRKALAISRINMAMVLELEGGLIKRAAVAYGAVGKTAYRAAPLEEFLVGKRLDGQLVDAAAGVAEELVTRVLQGRKTTPYKKKIAAAVLRRALEKAMGGVQV